MHPYLGQKVALLPWRGGGVRRPASRQEAKRAAPSSRITDAHCHVRGCLCFCCLHLSTKPLCTRSPRCGAPHCAAPIQDSDDGDCVATHADSDDDIGIPPIPLPSPLTDLSQEATYLKRLELHNLAETRQIRHARQHFCLGGCNLFGLYNLHQRVARGTLVEDKLSCRLQKNDTEGRKCA
jgi:hypothetical protein